MENKTKNRKRNVTVSFHTTEEEKQQIFARINVCGMSKAQYFIQSLLHQNIVIAAGKYKSDRLAVELKNIYSDIKKLSENDQDKMLLEEITKCRFLLEQLLEIINDNQ